jgi:hypothetical protein
MIKKPEHAEESRQSEANLAQHNTDSSNKNNQNTLINNRNSAQEELVESESLNGSIIVDHNFKKLKKKGNLEFVLFFNLNT